jgi:DNA-binding NtrC family response regulator
VLAGGNPRMSEGAMAISMISVRVVLVDGDRAGASALLAKLDARAPISIAACTNVEAALSELSFGGASVVVASADNADLRGIDGFQLCRIIKSPAHPDLHHVPVILVTSRPIESRARALAREVAAFGLFHENDAGLAAAVARARDASASGRDASTLARGRALVVVSHQASRKALAWTLKQDGFESEIYGDSVAARFAASLRFDLVVVSATLREDDGSELWKKFVRRQNAPPVIVIGACHEGEPWDSVLLQGAYDRIDEPLRPEEIRAACRRALLHSEYRRVRSKTPPTGGSGIDEGAEREPGRQTGGTNPETRCEKEAGDSPRPEAALPVPTWVFHDLNNVLTTILQQSELLESPDGPHDEVEAAARLRAIRKAVERGRELTRGIGPEFRSVDPLCGESTGKGAPTVGTTLRAVRGNGERIVVVDDIDSVLRLMAEVLTRLNYRVSTVRSGEEALEVLRQSDDVDLVLLDVVMPGMDGLDAYRRIRELRPALPVVLSSGDRSHPLLAELAKEGVSILDKPFSAMCLSQMVSSALPHGNPPGGPGRSNSGIATTNGGTGREARAS